MLDSGSRHDLLAYSWHGLILRNALGAMDMLLGAGMIRIAFLKQLPHALIRFFVKDRHSLSAAEQDALLTIKAALIVLGLLVTEAGALLYYLATSTK